MNDVLTPIMSKEKRNAFDILAIAKKFHNKII